MSLKEPIISPHRVKAKPIEKVSPLTAAEFFKDWESDPNNDGSGFEFAEAYAVAYMNWYASLTVRENARKTRLLERAAELLRPSEPGEEWKWESKRDQWLKDAGVEE